MSESHVRTNSQRPPLPRRYFINDTVCRVKNVPGYGCIVDIGVVEYPSTASATSISRTYGSGGDTANRVQTHAEFKSGIRNGFTGMFYVTWGHNSHESETVRAGIRELLSAEDESVFLLDRQLIPGMFVRKLNDDGSIGIVKAVDVFLSASIPPGSHQVVKDIEARSLEWDWQAESLLGNHFMTNGWIGQIVEVKRSAQLGMELDSQFQVSWEETLADDGVQRIVGNEIHLRFSAVGDRVMLSMLELSRAKWISQPEGKGLFWPVVRPFEYSNQSATVEYIFTDAIRFKWIEKLSSVLDADSVPPKEWICYQDFEMFLRSRRLQPLKLPVPETKRIGEFITLFSELTELFDIQTYDRWANSYLHEMKLRSSTTEPKEGPQEKRPRMDLTDSSKEHFYNGTLDTYKKVGSANTVNSGRIISRRSRVAVEWSQTCIESLPSTELVPILLDQSHQPGTIVRLLILARSPYVQREEAAYGVVIRNNIDLQSQENLVTVNYFLIPFDTNVPVLDAVLKIPVSHVAEHRLYNYRPGSILVRSNPYDEFSAGIFLGASQAGELITACPNGKIMKVWPNRVIQLNKKAEFNRNKKNKNEEDWIVGKGRCRHNGLNLPMELTNLNPPSTSFAHHVEEEFIDKRMKVWEGSCDTHFALSGEFTVLNDEQLTDRFLRQEIACATILPEGIWMKYAMNNKNLYFAAVEGPVGTVYEDSILFFEAGLPQAWTNTQGDFSYIRFVSFYSKQINSDLFLDGRVYFTDRSLSREIERLPPSLASILLTIIESSLRAEPIYPSRGLLGKLPSISKEYGRRDINISALIQVAVSIITQLKNPPIAWKAELKSYYMIHIPKFCARVTRWITERSTTEEAPKFALLPINNRKKMDELLFELQNLMELYSQMW